MGCKLKCRYKDEVLFGMIALLHEYIAFWQKCLDISRLQMS